MITLYGFWRSTAAFRVRMALNLKALPFTEHMIDLDRGEQHGAAFLAVNPQGAVPAAVFPDGTILTQSLAVLEYLEELHPAPALLPHDDPAGRARVRSLALLWAADHHPLVVSRIRSYLAGDCGLSPDATAAWVRHWFREGLAVGERRLAADRAADRTTGRHPGRFCHGDIPTIADLCLVAHAVNATTFDVSYDAFPLSAAIVSACLELDAIASAVPLRQPGAPSNG